MSKYRSLFIKSVIFILLIIGTDIVAGHLMRSLEMKTLEHSPFAMIPEYTMWKVNTDIVVIGASEAQHSYIPGIIEKRLGKTVYNCGNDGSRFYYQNTMIHGILKRYTPELIIWSISPQELCSPSSEDKDRLSRLNTFYNEDEFCKKALSTKSKYEPLKLKSESYVFNSRLLTYLYKLFTADYPYEKGAYAPLYGTDKGLEIKNRSWSNSYDKEIANVFEETIKACKEKGAGIVIVFTPRFEKEEHENLTSYKKIKEILQKYDTPLIEDLYHHPSLMKASLFKDHGHMNNDGATIFNEMLCDKLDHIFQPRPQ